MGWCDDVNEPLKYNKLIKIKGDIKHEKLRRKDDKYNLLIPIKFNFDKPKSGSGAVFLFILQKIIKQQQVHSIKEKIF